LYNGPDADRYSDYHGNTFTDRDIYGDRDCDGDSFVYAWVRSDDIDRSDDRSGNNRHG
jgi:hypothetical protein